jgi:hypothetical protein
MEKHDRVAPARVDGDVQAFHEADPVRPTASTLAFGTDDPRLKSEDDSLDSITEAELAKDSSHVRLDGRLGHEKPLGNLGVGQTVGHRHEHLLLAVGERRGR